MTGGPGLIEPKQTKDKPAVVADCLSPWGEEKE